MNINLTDWRERYRVRIGFVLGMIFIWRAQPRNILFLIAGLTLALIGILIRQWASGCVKKMDELAASGPYAIVRHPLYFGSFLAAAGFILSVTSFSLSNQKPYFDRTLFFWCSLWMLIDSIYRPKIEKEEAQLRQKFAQEHALYSQSVPKLMPTKIHRSQFDFSTFQLELWKKNKEVSSAIGYFIIAFILVSRYFYR